jgi:hypothetical protein
VLEIALVSMTKVIKMTQNHANPCYWLKNVYDKR